MTKHLLAAALAAGLTLAPSARAVNELTPESGFAIEARYEYLDGAFRAGTQGDHGILVNRVELLLGDSVETEGGTLGAQLEVWDARAFMADGTTPVTTGSSNAFEPVNAWLSWTSERAGTFRVGRLTEDLGSRRLVGRNIYRNTTNTFTGADWRGDVGPWRVQALLYSPDARRPNSRDALRDNDAQLDEASLDRLFYGFYAERQLSARTRLELYTYRLDEDDTDATESRNRRITTPGARWLRSAPEGGFDAELEVALQFGEVRATAAPTDTNDLDHFAHLVHAELGWRAAADAPRASLEFAWASGDDDPTDGDSGTFDSLYGVIVPDYGPSGIWSVLNRRNTFSGVARIEGRPAPNLLVHVLYRHIRLAEEEDAWVSANLRDPTGASGDEVGDTFEARLRWWTFEEKVRVEAGWVHFAKGEFARNVPGAPGDDNVNYFWFTTRLAF
jgi:hypothetical protein